jgi:hypothetical protein
LQGPIKQVTRTFKLQQNENFQQSEVYHFKAIEILCTFVEDCPLLNHFLSSYHKNYTPHLEAIPEQEEFSHFSESLLSTSNLSTAINEYNTGSFLRQASKKPNSHTQSKDFIQKIKQKYELAGLEKMGSAKFVERADLGNGLTKNSSIEENTNKKSVPHEDLGLGSGEKLKCSSGSEKEVGYPEIKRVEMNLLIKKVGDGGGSEKRVNIQNEFESIVRPNGRASGNLEDVQSDFSKKNPMTQEQIFSQKYEKVEPMISGAWSPDRGLPNNGHQSNFDNQNANKPNLYSNNNTDTKIDDSEIFNITGQISIQNIYDKNRDNKSQFPHAMGSQPSEPLNFVFEPNSKKPAKPDPRLSDANLLPSQMGRDKNFTINPKDQSNINMNPSQEFKVNFVLDNNNEINNYHQQLQQ